MHLLRLVANEDVRSPRLFEDTITADLERICMKALARRASDRFTVARDFAEEIRWLLANQSPSPGIRPSSVAIHSGKTPVMPMTEYRGTCRANGCNADWTTRIVPKGLRSFDATDASFFLELLPGPFDREGFPKAFDFGRLASKKPIQSKRFKLVWSMVPQGVASLR